MADHQESHHCIGGGGVQPERKARGNPRPRRGAIKEKIYSDVRDSMSYIATTIVSSFIAGVTCRNHGGGVGISTPEADGGGGGGDDDGEETA